MSSRTATLPIVPMRRNTTDRKQVQEIANRILERRQPTKPPPKSHATVPPNTQ